MEAPYFWADTRAAT